MTIVKFCSKIDYTQEGGTMKNKILLLICLSLLFQTSCSTPIKTAVNANTETYNTSNDANVIEKTKLVLETPKNYIVPKQSPKPTKTPVKTEPPKIEDSNQIKTDEVEPFSHTKIADISSLDGTKKSWYFMRNTTKTIPSAQTQIDLSKYNAFYVDKNKTKQIYLTFDEGYENGYTSKILDTLLENDVKACFFITGDYIKTSPELVERMVSEGHVVANHSYTHKSFPTLSQAEIEKDINDCNDAFKKLTGRNMDPFFRPPMGEYSEQSLAITNNLGYTTIFWSLAYQDWLVDKQPSIEEAEHQFVDYVHDGAIVLLHAVSSANANSLDNSIKKLKKEGYTFISLYDLYN